MAEKQRYYLCIDMKTFYASVECAERDLNPFETDLVVADPSRGRGAICLAITPKMKARGIHNRCRLFEIPGNVKYEIAPPRMQLYIEYAADIYGIYLDWFRPEDIYVYSIDESFIDVTDYLQVYSTDPVSLAKKLMNEIAEKLHIPSTAGVGTNLYLAKIALDITAKHAKDHIGYLDEKLYCEQLWDHLPLTDFWMIGGGKERKLARYGMHTMRDIAKAPEDLLYRLFGIDAELMIDHAWGRESCLMQDIKNYRSRSHSVSFSQILPKDYTYDQARTVLKEMALNGCQELMRRHVICRKVWIGVGYSKDVIPPVHGTAKLSGPTALYSLMEPYILHKFDELADRETPIRRLGISFADVVDEGCEGYDFFSDWNSLDREKAREQAVLEIKDKYGKNAVLRGMNYMDGATQRERNDMIGGHRAGRDDPRRES